MAIGDCFTPVSECRAGPWKGRRGTLYGFPLGEWEYSAAHLYYKHPLLPDIRIPSDTPLSYVGRIGSTRIRKSLEARWGDRMVRMQQKIMAKRLRPIFTALWAFGYLWGAMLLVAATAWIFRMTVWSTLS